jgi:hypothetical protein
MFFHLLLKRVKTRSAKNAVCWAVILNINVSEEYAASLFEV